MKKKISLVICLFSSLVLCNCTEYNKGTLIGATIGGLGGSIIGKGQGNLLAIGLGTTVGIIFGQHIGNKLDQAQNIQIDQQIKNTMEMNRDGQSNYWKDPKADVMTTTLPLHTYRATTGHYCREFQQEIIIDSKIQRAYGTACRQSDGQWQIINH